ncbi:MAG: hypothetical protein IKV14_05590 [Muribaculaceae bacterium]|nr:hypothetical protein [Muribaculaceae bacterium]
MNYIDKLEAKRILLKEEVSVKEKKLSDIYKSLFDNTQDDIIGRIAKKLSLITTFSNGIRIGLSVFKTIF